MRRVGNKSYTVTVLCGGEQTLAEPVRRPRCLGVLTGRGQCKQSTAQHNTAQHSTAAVRPPEGVREGCGANGCACDLLGCCMPVCFYHSGGERCGWGWVAVGRGMAGLCGLKLT